MELVEHLGPIRYTIKPVLAAKGKENLKSKNLPTTIKVWQGSGSGFIRQDKQIRIKIFRMIITDKKYTDPDQGFWGQ